MLCRPAAGVARERTAPSLGRAGCAASKRARTQIEAFALACVAMGRMASPALARMSQPCYVRAQPALLFTPVPAIRYPIELSRVCRHVRLSRPPARRRCRARATSRCAVYAGGAICTTSRPDRHGVARMRRFS